MKEYFDIIDEKFKNKDYFKELFSSFQLLTNKDLKQFNICIKLSFMMGVIMFGVGVAPLFVSTNDLSIGHSFLLMNLGILLPIFVFLIGDEVTQKRDKLDIKKQEIDFFKKLKNDKNLVKDLSTLVVCEKTEFYFNKIVDNLINDNSSNELKYFNCLFIEYVKGEESKAEQSRRDSWLKDTNVIFKKHTVKSTKQDFQFKAREKVLEML